MSKTYIGDAIPDFTYGITLTAAWKGLDLTVFGSGSYGNDIFNCATRSDHISANKMKKFFYDDRWTPEHTQASVPRANATSMDKYLVSDAMVFDGSYFKIKQIQLGYTLPKAWTKKAFIQNKIRMFLWKISSRLLSMMDLIRKLLPAILLVWVSIWVLILLQRK